MSIDSRAEFMRRFTLHARQPLPRPVLEKLRPAAVLIPIVERPSGLTVILTQRATHLRHHPGQISFPGGRYESTDGNLMVTALRETEEEIGLERSQIEVVGQLQDYPVISNYLIRPFVGFVQPPADNAVDTDPNASLQLTRQRSEVADIFEVPLAELLHQPNHYVYKLQRFIYPEVYFIPYQQRNIWGATAGILRELADHLIPENQQHFRPLN